ncbi:MAG: hypothetical protein IT442_06460 [Phycisphaeraceae bacterium]|nr:hypothetical protein [Phycisphaeraceae bacterium]
MAINRPGRAMALWCAVVWAGAAMAGPGDLVRTYAYPGFELSPMFGSSIGSVGDEVLIGAWNVDGAYPGAGAVYVYNSLTGALEHTFWNPSGPNFKSGSDFFGGGIVTQGDRMLVSAKGSFGLDAFNLPSIQYVGQAYLYDIPSRQLLATFDAPGYDPLNPKQLVFGATVAFLGDDVVASTPGAYSPDVPPVQKSGAVYRFDGSSYALEQTYWNPEPKEYAGYGSPVMTNSTKMLVASPSDDEAGLGTGAYYLLDGATGSVLHKFMDPTPHVTEGFGIGGTGDTTPTGSFATLTEELVIIGVTDGFDPDRVYIFDANTYQLLRTLYDPTPGDYSSFGRTVAVIGDQLLVGDPDEDPNPNDGDPGIGAVYQFDLGTGDLVGTYENPYAGDGLYRSTGHGFGLSLSQVNGQLLVGARDRVYQFTLLPEPAGLGVLATAVGGMMIRRRRC